MKLGDYVTKMENIFITLPCYFSFCNLLFLVIFKYVLSFLLLLFVVDVN